MPKSNLQKEIQKIHNNPGILELKNGQIDYNYLIQLLADSDWEGAKQRDLCMLLNSMSKFGNRIKFSIGIIDKLKSLLIQFASMCDEQDISLTLNSLSKLNFKIDMDLKTTLIQAVRENACHFNAQNISLTLNALFKLGFEIDDESLKAQLIQAVSTNVFHFNAQSLSLTLNALFKLNIGTNRQLRELFGMDSEGTHFAAFAGEDSPEHDSMQERCEPNNSKIKIDDSASQSIGGSKGDNSLEHDSMQVRCEPNNSKIKVADSANQSRSDSNDTKKAIKKYVFPKSNIKCTLFEYEMRQLLANLEGEVETSTTFSISKLKTSQCKFYSANNMNFSIVVTSPFDYADVCMNALQNEKVLNNAVCSAVELQKQKFKKADFGVIVPIRIGLTSLKSLQDALASKEMTRSTSMASRQMQKFFEPGCKDGTWFFIYLDKPILDEKAGKVSLLSNPLFCVASDVHLSDSANDLIISAIATSAQWESGQVVGHLIRPHDYQEEGSPVLSGSLLFAYILRTIIKTPTIVTAEKIDELLGNASVQELYEYSVRAGEVLSGLLHSITSTQLLERFKSEYFSSFDTVRELNDYLARFTQSNFQKNCDRLHNLLSKPGINVYKHTREQELMDKLDVFRTFAASLGNKMDRVPAASMELGHALLSKYSKVLSEIEYSSARMLDHLIICTLKVLQSYSENIEFKYIQEQVSSKPIHELAKGKFNVDAVKMIKKYYTYNMEYFKDNEIGKFSASDREEFVNGAIKLISVYKLLLNSTQNRVKDKKLCDRYINAALKLTNKEFTDKLDKLMDKRIGIAQDTMSSLFALKKLFAPFSAFSKLIHDIPDYQQMRLLIKEEDKLAEIKHLRMIKALSKPILLKAEERKVPALDGTSVKRDVKDKTPLEAYRTMAVGSKILPSKFIEDTYLLLDKLGSDVSQSDIIEILSCILTYLRKRIEHNDSESIDELNILFTKAASRLFDSLDISLVVMAHVLSAEMQSCMCWHLYKTLSRDCYLLIDSKREKRGFLRARSDLSLNTVKEGMSLMQEYNRRIDTLKVHMHEVALVLKNEAHDINQDRLSLCMDSFHKRVMEHSQIARKFSEQYTKFEIAQQNFLEAKQMGLLPKGKPGQTMKNSCLPQIYKLFSSNNSAQSLKHDCMSKQKQCLSVFSELGEISLQDFSYIDKTVFNLRNRTRRNSFGEFPTLFFSDEVTEHSFQSERKMRRANSFCVTLSDFFKGQIDSFQANDAEKSHIDDARVTPSLAKQDSDAPVLLPSDIGFSDWRQGFNHELERSYTVKDFGGNGDCAIYAYIGFLRSNASEQAKQVLKSWELAEHGDSVSAIEVATFRKKLVEYIRQKEVPFDEQIKYLSDIREEAYTDMQVYYDKMSRQGEFLRDQELALIAERDNVRIVVVRNGCPIPLDTKDNSVLTAILKNTSDTNGNPYHYVAYIPKVENLHKEESEVLWRNSQPSATEDMDDSSVTDTSNIESAYPREQQHGIDTLTNENHSQLDFYYEFSKIQGICDDPTIPIGLIQGFKKHVLDNAESYNKGELVTAINAFANFKLNLEGTLKETILSTLFQVTPNLDYNELKITLIALAKLSVKVDVDLEVLLIIAVTNNLLRYDTYQRIEVLNLILSLNFGSDKIVGLCKSVIRSFTNVEPSQFSYIFGYLVKLNTHVDNTLSAELLTYISCNIHALTAQQLLDIVGWIKELEISIDSALQHKLRDRVEEIIYVFDVSRTTFDASGIKFIEPGITFNDSGLKFDKPGKIFDASGITSLLAAISEQDILPFDDILKTYFQGCVYMNNFKLALDNHQIAIILKAFTRRGIIPAPLVEENLKLTIIRNIRDKIYFNSEELVEVLHSLISLRFKINSDLKVSLVESIINIIHDLEHNELASILNAFAIFRHCSNEELENGLIKLIWQNLSNFIPHEISMVLKGLSEFSFKYDEQLIYNLSEIAARNVEYFNYHQLLGIANSLAKLRMLNLDEFEMIMQHLHMHVRVDSTLDAMLYETVMLLVKLDKDKYSQARNIFADYEIDFDKIVIRAQKSISESCINGATDFQLGIYAVAENLGEGFLKGKLFNHIYVDIYYPNRKLAIIAYDDDSQGLKDLNNIHKRNVSILEDGGENVFCIAYKLWSGLDETERTRLFSRILQKYSPIHDTNHAKSVSRPSYLA